MDVVVVVGGVVVVVGSVVVVVGDVVVGGVVVVIVAALAVLRVEPLILFLSPFNPSSVRFPLSPRSSSVSSHSRASILIPALSGKEANLRKSA